MEYDLLLIFCSDYSIARFGTERKEFPPLGVLYLAAACEQCGINVGIQDMAELSDDQIPSATVIGLSINSSYIYPAYKRRIDVLRNKCKYLVAGGQHATIFPYDTFIELGLDYLMIGEGEYVLPSLVKRLCDGKETDSISDIPYTYCEKNIKGAQYSERMRIQDLNSLPFPARHLLKKTDILLKNRIPKYDIYSTNIITSRGCPYGCKFCGNVYKGFAYRSGENVKREIEQILVEYPEIRGLIFMDENLFFNKSHAMQIIDCMSNFQLKWTCNARVDTYTQELVPLLKHSNCVEIKYGIESGCQRILDAMNKKITIEQIEETLRITTQNGIGTKCFLMFGYPGDNENSASETISFLKKNKENIGRVNLFSFAPVPNSLVYKEMICKDFSWEDYRIYKQLIHWWGDDEQFLEVQKGYKILKQYIVDAYGDI